MLAVVHDDSDKLQLSAHGTAVCYLVKHLGDARKRIYFILNMYIMQLVMAPLTVISNTDKLEGRAIQNSHVHLLFRTSKPHACSTSQRQAARTERKNSCQKVLHNSCVMSLITRICARPAVLRISTALRNTTGSNTRKKDTP